MVKKIIWFVVLPIVIGVSIYFIFFNKKTTSPSNTSTENTNTTSSNSNSDSSNTSGSDLTNFSTKDQNVGSASESVYTLDKVANSAETGYQKFVFSLSSEGTDNPYVMASYISAQGVIRVTLKQVTTDNSGLGYQKEISIDTNGVMKLYHNISSDQTEEIYDIGVSKEASFLLYSEKTSTGWNVVLNVEYPGIVVSSNDLGSTEFGVGAQSISGVGVDASAAINSYTYGINTGVLKFVWNVSSSDTNPIPSVSAAYDSSNNLVVTFGSLSIDKVVKAVNNTDLPQGLILNTNRTGNVSTYTFSGMNTQLSYKLSASTSPNQVSLEIQL